MNYKIYYLEFCIYLINYFYDGDWGGGWGGGGWGGGGWGGGGDGGGWGGWGGWGGGDWGGRGGWGTTCLIADVIWLISNFPVPFSTLDNNSYALSSNFWTFIFPFDALVIVFLIESKLTGADNAAETGI